MIITNQNIIGSLQKASGVASILPVAYNVLITGDFIEGVTLAGSYQYTDPNNVPQGVTTFKWYRATDSIGTGKTVVSTTQSYTVLGSDEGDYISFEVTPKNTDGDVGIPRATTYAEVPIPLPLANSVSYGSVLFQGETLTGAYTYVENGSDPEGVTTFKWYTATDSSGTGQVAIVGATSQTYILQATDKDNFISFEVTPVTNTGVSGASVQTAYQTAIGGLPVATNVVYTGVVQVGEIQTGSYDYSGAPEGSSGKYWYRYNSVGGGSAIYLGSGSTYTIIAADEGNTIKFRVIPKSVSGVAGTNVYSPTRGVVAPAAVTTFDFTVNTANAGTSSSTQFKLPLASSSTINAVVSWGDGSSDTITSYNQAEILHTYSTAGTYAISIDGVVNGWKFNSAGEELKMLNISAWGTFDFTGTTAFYDCANLTLTATDNPTITTADMLQTFRGCTVFNGDISGWDISNVTSLSQLVTGCPVFNQDISGWNMSGVTNISYMIFNSDGFDQSLASWDVTGITNAAAFMQNSTGLSTANYDATLIAWASQSVNSGVSIHFGSATYTAGGTAATARATLVTAGWTIIDGGTA